MPIARPEPQAPRVIAHVDMDCFYVQVEQRRCPELRGLPTAVVQYNAWKGGGLIAVGYEARKFGVKRSMRGDDAKKVCPGIHLVQVPVARGKADLNLYRDAGSEVVSILATRGRCERASIDEVYLDLTDAAEQMLATSPPEFMEEHDEEILKSHILGLPDDGCNQEESVKQWLFRSDADRHDKLLACGAIIVAHVRVEVLKKTSFTCSAGIAHNKMLAKLASGMHKPAQQTVVPYSSVTEMLASLPIKKMKQLGGKLGNSLQRDLGVATVGDLLNYPEEKLQELYGRNTGTWLWNISRGISGDEVDGRLLPKSHGCGKTFPGQQALRTLSSVKSWLNGLCEELSERIQSDLDKNKRIAHTLILHANGSKAHSSQVDRKFPSKSCPLRYGTEKIQEDALKLFESGLREFLDSQSTDWAITSLSVSASKILPVATGMSSISRYFGGNHKTSFSKQASDISTDDTFSCLSSEKVSEISEFGNFSETDERHLFDHQSGDKSDTMKTERRDKGTCSIMNHFYPTRSTSDDLKSENGGTHSEDRDRMEIYENRGEERCETWRLNAEDVDPSVVSELPPEIQQELQSWIHSFKRATPSKRPGSSIAHYFSPLKK